MPTTNVVRNEMPKKILKPWAAGVARLAGGDGDSDGSGSGPGETSSLLQSSRRETLPRSSNIPRKAKKDIQCSKCKKQPLSDQKNAVLHNWHYCHSEFIVGLDWDGWEEAQNRDALTYMTKTLAG